MKKRRIFIYPFSLSEISECSLRISQDVITSVKFLMQVNEAEESLCFKVKELGTQTELAIETDLDETEIENIYNALRGYDVEDAADVLRERGITDLISIFELRKLGQMIEVLSGAYKETSDAVIAKFPFYHVMRESGIEDVLGTLKMLKRRGFFASWDKALLFFALKKRPTICRGFLTRIGVRKRQVGKAFVGTIEPDTAYRASESGIPELMKRRAERVKIQGITKDGKP